MSLLQPSLPTPKYLQEDELTQECRDLMLSLPKEPGWIAPYLYQYQGCWLPPRRLQGLLALHKHFQPHDTDILLATTPKAGTTWFKAILFALVNRLRYSDPQQHPLLTSNPHDLIPSLEKDLYSQVKVPDLTSFASPRLFQTHLPHKLLPTCMKDSACKIVSVCRNPKDTFVSLWHYTSRLRASSRYNLSFEEAFDQFCKGASPYGPYWDHVLGYWKESSEKPQKVLFLKYEVMKEQPAASLRRLAEFLGCPFSPEEEVRGVVDRIVKLCSFDSLRKLEVNKSGRLASGEDNNAYFRRGEIGDWKNYLTAEVADKLDRIIEEKFHGTGLRP